MSKNALRLCELAAKPHNLSQSFPRAECMFVVSQSVGRSLFLPGNFIVNALVRTALFSEEARFPLAFSLDLIAAVVQSPWTPLTTSLQVWSVQQEDCNACRDENDIYVALLTENTLAKKLV